MHLSRCRRSVSVSDSRARLHRPLIPSFRPNLCLFCGHQKKQQETLSPFLLLSSLLRPCAYTNNRQHAIIVQTSLHSSSSPAGPVQGANGAKARGGYMGPTSHCGRGFSLASPHPGGEPPTALPTSELLGSATFQTPEGPPSVFLFRCSSPALRPRL